MEINKILPVAPLAINNFSSFIKYEMRKRLGIKQTVKESDLEEFKRDGSNIHSNIEVTRSAIDIYTNT